MATQELLNNGEVGIRRDEDNPALINSEKLEQANGEDRAILEAIEVGSTASSGQDDIPTNLDLEKATTQKSTTQHDPATRTITAQDWTGPDDPENPMNWSILKRSAHTGAIALLAFACTAGSSMVTPSTSEIAEHFHVSRTAAILSLSLFVVGLAIGPTIAAPMSETFGRSVVYKVTAPVYMLFVLGAGFSNSFGGMLVCRLLAGAAGGPVLAVGAGTTADMYPAHVRAIGSAVFIMAPFLGPAFGPVIGGFAAQYKGYRWTQWCTIFVGVAAWIPVLFTQETYKKTILQRRAKRLNIPPPPTPKVAGFTYAKRLVTITIGRPILMLALEPIVLFLSLYIAFLFGILYAFFAAWPYTFEGVYGFNIWQYGLTFLSIGVGNTFGLISHIVIDRKVYMRKYREAVKAGHSSIAPEHRLYAAMIGSVFAPIGLFWFAWTARRDVHWISPVLSGIPFAFGNISIFIPAMNYIIDVYGPLNGASAAAANGLLRYIMGSVFPLFTLQMYSTLGVDWATSLLGFISIAMLPIPFVIFKYGAAIRAKSKYVVVKD